MKRVMFLSLIVGIVMLTAGCATTTQRQALNGPLVDLRTEAERAAYPRGLAECQRYAEQVPGPGHSAVAGAVVGAAAGAIIARMLGYNVNRGPAARIGALAGAARGAASGAESERAVVANCLRWRGYNVLN